MNDRTKAWLGVAFVFAFAAVAFAVVYSIDRAPTSGTTPRAAITSDSPAPKYMVSFYEALQKGDLLAADAALSKHPDLLEARFGTETALHVAARCDQPDMIDLLLDRGADRGARGRFNGTALHWACWFGSKSAAERLIARGFDVEDKHDAFGSSPLLWTAHGSANIQNPSGDYAGTALLLIANGAQADTRNAQGTPAVVMASMRVAEILLANGAKAPTTQPSSHLTT